MTSFLKKTMLASGLAATALVSATPASAQYYGSSYGGYHHHDDTGTAIAVGAGILGIIAIAVVVHSKV